MSSFGDYIEKENNRKREESYIDNPNQIAWKSMAIGLFGFMMLFVFCPMMSKNSGEEIEVFKKKCSESFYQYSLFAIVKGKEYKPRTYYMTVHNIGLRESETKVINCNCPELHSMYNSVNIGDTILKPADTLLVKIYNSPKYEELNRYETFRRNNM